MARELASVDAATELANASVPAAAAAAVAAPSRGAGTARGRFSIRSFRALSNPHFRLLFIGNVLQFGAMQMQLLVRGVLVFQLTGSFAALGVVSLANAVPMLMLSLVGGVLADRAPKKTIVQSAQLLNMLNAAVLALLAARGLLGFEHLLISAVLQGGVNALMMPARQSLIPDIVGREGLMNAVALNTSGMTLMQLVGPGLGGALLSLMSPAAVFTAMAGLYLGAVTFTFRLPKQPVHAHAAAESGRHGSRGGRGLRDLVDGVRYVVRDRTVRTIVWVNFLVVLVALPYTMMLPGFVHDVLQKGAAEQGILMSLSGVGAVAGSLVVGSLPDTGRGRLLLVNAVCLGLALVAFASSTNYYVTLPIMLLVGAATAGRMSLGQVLIQSYSADAYRGRVMAVWMMQFSLVSFGTFGVGVLSEWLGPQVAIGGMAAGLVVAMCLVAVFTPFRKLD